jgi:uncharacterized phage protein (TIGR01671 family)
MREIKFRALCEGKWVNVPVGYKRLNIDRDTLSQFTGLQDKNDVDIYEGDILAYGENVPERAVIFENGSFRLLDNDNHANQVVVMDTVRRLAIVGNIHENPELLELK